MPNLEPKLPVRSMTGFASTQHTIAAGELTVVLRTVNGRNLDLHFHLGSDFAPFENALRALLKDGCGRGNVEVRLSLAPRASNGTHAVQFEQLESYVQAFRDARERLGLTGEPDLNRLFSLPGVVTSAGGVKTAVSEDDVLPAVRQTLTQLNQFREREGAALVSAIGQLLDEIDERRSEIGSIRVGAIPELKARLEERLRVLLAEATIPPQRLAEEASIAADRSDIAEELTRLGVHSQELRRLLNEGGAVGKRLDFLLQEINRETNTVLSKTSGVGQVGLSVTNLALAVKANIERIREQSLNLE